MATFEYQALGGNGVRDGAGGATVIEAPDRATAVRLLRERGITPSRLEMVSTPAAPLSGAVPHPPAPESPGLGSAPVGPKTGTGRRAMSRAEMAAFIRELATAVQAGLPLVQALKTIARSAHSPRQAAMLAHLTDQVEHGKSLADAAASWGRPFTELTVNLIRAGDLSGRMDEVLDQAASLLDRDLKLRRTMLSGLLYPAILAALIVVAIAAIVTVIVPRILAPLSGQLRAAQLPLPTRVVVGTADFFQAYWWLIGAGVAGGTLWLMSLYRQPGPRLAIDRGLLRVPLLGKVLRDVAVARFTRTLGTLVSAGLPALTALRITRATLGNRAMEAVVEEVCDQVAHGKTIADPMERSGYFPPLLVQIVNVGERSGRLPQMLHQAAGVFEDRTENSVKLFTTAFPPVLVVIAAVVVGFVVAAILLPLIQMQELIG